MLQVLAASAGPKVVDLDADSSAAAPDTTPHRKMPPIGGRGDGEGESDGRRRWKWRAVGPGMGNYDGEEDEEEDAADYDDEIPAEDSDGVPLRWIACTACMQVGLPCCRKITYCELMQIKFTSKDILCLGILIIPSYFFCESS